MKDLMLAVLVFEHAVGRRWFVECHRIETGDATATDVHFRIRHLIEERVALKKKGAMRLRASTALSLHMGDSKLVPFTQFVLVAEKGMDTRVSTDAVPSFPANDLRPSEEHYQTYIQMKLDDAVAHGFRPVSISLTSVV